MSTTPAPTGIEAQVCADIAARQQKGIAKYGTTVADNPEDLREWLTPAMVPVHAVGLAVLPARLRGLPRRFRMLCSAAPPRLGYRVLAIPWRMGAIGRRGRNARWSSCDVHSDHGPSLLVVPAAEPSIADHCRDNKRSIVRVASLWTIAVSA